MGIVLSDVGATIFIRKNDKRRVSHRVSLPWREGHRDGTPYARHLCMSTEARRHRIRTHRSRARTIAGPASPRDVRINTPDPFRCSSDPITNTHTSTLPASPSQSRHRALAGVRRPATQSLALADGTEPNLRYTPATSPSHRPTRPTLAPCTTADRAHGGPRHRPTRQHSSHTP